MEKKVKRVNLRLNPAPITRLLYEEIVIFATVGSRKFKPPSNHDRVLVIDDAGRNLPVPETNIFPVSKWLP